MHLIKQKYKLTSFSSKSVLILQPKQTDIRSNWINIKYKYSKSKRATIRFYKKINLRSNRLLLLHL